MCDGARAGAVQPVLGAAGGPQAERSYDMGEKGKGKDSGKTKKVKAAKTGNRPHEERAREALKIAPK